MIIDFDLASTNRVMKITKDRGTPGYYPDKVRWRDGSSKWDILAFMAMMCEADMLQRYYMSFNKEVDCVKAIRRHVAKEKTCPTLGRLLQHTILEKNLDYMYSMNDIIDAINRVKFQEQVGDAKE